MRLIVGLGAVGKLAALPLDTALLKSGSAVKSSTVPESILGISEAVPLDTALEKSGSASKSSASSVGSLGLGGIGASLSNTSNTTFLPTVVLASSPYSRDSVVVLSNT